MLLVIANVQEKQFFARYRKNYDFVVRRNDSTLYVPSIANIIQFVGFKIFFRKNFTLFNIKFYYIKSYVYLF